MNQLEERLRTAGRSHTDITPDIGSIRSRGLKIRRSRQIGTSLAAVVLVATGGVAALNVFRPASDTTIVSASDGQLTDDEASDPNRGGRPDDSDSPEGTTTTSAETGDSGDTGDTDDIAIDSAEDEATAVEVESGGGDDEGGATTEPALPMPSPTSVSDGTGGWLTVVAGGIEHLRVDGTSGMISFPDPPGGLAQRWPTDVAFIEGRHYLLVDQFVNRQDLEAERVKAMAEAYGVPYDAEAGAFALEGVATPIEIDSLNHWEVSILAVDLTTDEVLTVEERVINSVQSPEWVYNGHITSDGTNILVMRELWQGHCLYAEGLTLDGQPVDVVDAKVYAKPEGLDMMTYDDIDAVFSAQAEPLRPCRTLAELPDSGLGVWGTQADTAQMEAFRVAFAEAGLG